MTPKFDWSHAYKDYILGVPWWSLGGFIVRVVANWIWEVEGGTVENRIRKIVAFLEMVILVRFQKFGLNCVPSMRTCRHGSFLVH
jgi:hypothetical protein